MVQRLAISIVLTLSLALASGLTPAAGELTAASSGSSLNGQIELLEDIVLQYRQNASNASCVSGFGAAMPVAMPFSLRR